MSKSRAGESIFVLLLILGLAAFVRASFSYTVELRAMPLFFGVAGIALLVLVLIGGYLPAVRRWTDASLAAGWSKVPEGEKPKAKSPDRSSDVLRIMAYMVGLWVVVFFVGLTVSIPIFVTLFLTLEARVRLRNALICGAITVCIVVVGLQAMGIDLWAGIIPEIVPGYVGGSIMPLL